MDTQMMGMIGLGVLFLVAVLAAFMSAKAWHWGHVLLVMFVFLIGMGACILGAEVLRIRQFFLQKVADLEEKIEETTIQNAALEFGTFNDQLIARLSPEGSEPGGVLDGITTLRSRLRTFAQIRGRVWPGMRPAKVDPQTGDASVAFPQLVQGEPPRGDQGLGKDMTVFVFEDAPPNPQDPARGGQYLGRFQVVDVGADGITIAPLLVHSWSAAHMKRLAESRRLTWTLYETMPIDAHERLAFAGLSPEERQNQLQALLPARSVPEYVRDGTEATEEDGFPYTRDGRRLTTEEAEALAQTDPGEIEWRYVRPLHDYAFLFSELARRRVEMLAEYDAIAGDTERLKSMTESAKKDFAVRTKEKSDLQHDLAGFRREREAIEKHAAAVQSQRTAADTMLSRTLVSNQALSDQLAAAQLDVLESLRPR